LPRLQGSNDIGERGRTRPVAEDDSAPVVASADNVLGRGARGVWGGITIFADHEVISRQQRIADACGTGDIFIADRKFNFRSFNIRLNKEFV